MTHDDDLMVAVFEPDRWALTADPAQVAQVVTQVRSRRRKRLAIRAGSGAIAAGLVAALTFVALNTDSIRPNPRSDRTFFQPPRPTGPLPALRVRHVGSVDELVQLLPGTTITELRLDLPEVNGLTPTGELIAQNRSNELVLIDPESGHRTVLATLTKSDQTGVMFPAADDRVIVWAEGLMTEVGGDVYESQGLVLRCVDRATGAVHRIPFPERDSDGVPLPTNPGDFGVEYSVDAGRIALSVGRTGYPPHLSPADVSDVYVAARCGAPLELMVGHASNARLAGRSLYYVHDDHVWRRDLASGRAVPLATPARNLILLSDALVWNPRLGPVTTDWPRELQVARRDGAAASAVTLPDGWTLGLGPTTLAGQDWVVSWLDTDATSFGLYFPSRGGAVQVDAEPGIRASAVTGRHLLLTEWAPSGPTGTAWLLTLP